MSVNEIIRLLETRGRYNRAAEPLHVSDVDFKGSFDAILVGPNDQNGLVLVRSMEGTSINEIKRAVKALAAMLDRTGCMRPFTLVLTTTMSPNDPSIAALEDSCRVIPVPPTGNLEEHLRPLLPLRLPDPATAKKSADEALKEELGDGAKDPLVDALIRAARKSSDEVQRTMREEIDRVAALKSAEGGTR